MHADLPSGRAMAIPSVCRTVLAEGNLDDRLASEFGKSAADDVEAVVQVPGERAVIDRKTVKGDGGAIAGDLHRGNQLLANSFTLMFGCHKKVADMGSGRIEIAKAENLIAGVIGNDAGITLG